MTCKTYHAIITCWCPEHNLFIYFWPLRPAELAQLHGHLFAALGAGGLQLVGEKLQLVAAFRTAACNRGYIPSFYGTSLYRSILCICHGLPP